MTDRTARNIIPCLIQIFVCISPNRRKTGIKVTMRPCNHVAIVGVFCLFCRDMFRIILRRRPRRRVKASVINDPARGLVPVGQIRAEASAYLPGRLAMLASAHGFSYGKVTIKHNLSNWGSCSSKGNINLNLCLMTIPEELRDYVMLHELCHTKEMNHGPGFHALLESVCPGHRGLAARLKGYHTQ